MGVNVRRYDLAECGVKGFQGQPYTYPVIGRLVDSFGEAGRAPGA